RQRPRFFCPRRRLPPCNRLHPILRTPLSRRRPTQHPRMIATIVSTAVASVTTSTARLRRNNSSKRSASNARKGGAWRLPPFAILLCRLGSALRARMFRERRAPQKRCDQLSCSSKPGGVIVPPELLELTPCLYSSGSLKASE